MMTNPHHIRHFPRQSNVTAMITDSKGEVISVYHKLATIDLFVIGAVVILELREFETPTSENPVNITSLVNPIRWSLLAKADPEKIASLGL